MKEGFVMANQQIESYADVLVHTQELAESINDTVEGYTKMTRTIKTAIDTLESKAAHVQLEVLESLVMFIQEAEETPNFYTVASWDTYMQALSHAKKIQQGRKSNLVEMLRAKNDLRKAKSALIYDKHKI